MKDFQDKVAVITGAAGGFGREFAFVGARLGMKLALADVQQDALERTAVELRAQGAQVLALQCDVRDTEQVQALAAVTLEKFGAVHLLFNNAGVGGGGLIWEHAAADWEWVLGVNLWGVIHGVRIFTPLMLECARNDAGYRGHIVNTASIAGLLNAPNMGIYNVSKHAVVSLSETLYHDLQLIGAPIGASVLCPYYAPTGIHRSERNRPHALKTDAAPTASQALARVLSDKAVRSGKLTAAQVAQHAFDAIARAQFYICADAQELENVRTRMEDIVLQRNPGDPFAAMPQVRELLQARLKIK
jgi:NAD(P)-dependent dehydrogenase (short-subunit alcohol dehydrogenase family)